MKSNISKLQAMSVFKGMAFYLPIVSLFFISQGVDLSLIVISQVFYAVFYLVGNIPAGVLADKIGHKQSIVLSGFVAAIAYVLMVIIPGGFGLLVSYGLRGLSKSFVSGSDESLMYESVRASDDGNNNFRRAWGIYSSNDIVGFAASTLIAGLVLAQYGSNSYVPLILITGLTEVVALGIALTLKNPPKLPQAVKQKSAALVRSSLNLIRTNKTVFTLLLVPILTFSGEYFLYSVYQPYFQSAGVEPIYIGLVLTIGAIVNFFALRNSHRLENYLPLEKIVPSLSIMLAIAYGIMAVFTTPFLLIASFIAAKGLFNTQSPIISDYIHENTDSSIRATVTSSIAFIQQFFQIIARIVLGVLIGAIGISGTLKVQALYLLVGAIIAYFVMVACGCTRRIKQHHVELPE